MILKNINHPFGYHTEKIALMFFPLEKISDTPGDVTITTEMNGRVLSVIAEAYGKRKSASRTAGENEDMAMAMSLLLFSVLTELTGFKPPWGVLFGVRPARLMHAKCDKLGEDGAKQYFRDCLAEEDKIALAVRVMHSENEIIKLSTERSFSLYISIPFCPTRCSYCSFVSHSIENTKKLVEPYIDLLCKELEAKAKAAKDLQLRLESIYFGGGTPTTLTADQLERIMTVVENSFDLSSLREYTVEAGRPDTVTREKLRMLKQHGVTRISINPQTFNDEVRAKAGRRHTTAQTLESYHLAQECGFDNINMDLIAGLDGDTLASFKNSVDSAIALGAASVTVHNLALKSASYLVTESRYYDTDGRMLAAEMIRYAQQKLTESGYVPYYMYRQSKSLGNLENVGWCKPGKECLYNVFMMDETHSVFAAGAGAVTKLRDIPNGRIERIYNFKYPYEYNRSFEEILRRIEGIYAFYGA